MKMNTLLLILVITACSHVNKNEKKYYYSKKELKHGLVKVSKKDAPHLTSKEIETESYNRGRNLYKNHCLECHGIKGEGNGPMAYSMDPAPANLKAIAKNVPYFRLYMTVSKGMSDMPGWEKPVTENDLNDLAVYIKKAFN